MARRPARIGTLLLALGWAGCGLEPPCPAATLAPLDQTPAFAVVTSDYQSTAVALLDPRGELVTEAWIDSGTTEAGIVTALTGDVVLPTEPWPGELVLIDRFGVDVLTRISLPDGRVLGQAPTQLPRPDNAAESTSGFRSNPHDAIRLDATRALVSRFEKNANAAAPALDQGNDLVVVDLERNELVDRIALDALDVLEGDTRYLARPSRMVRVGAHVVVALGRLSGHWEAANGAVAIVHPETAEVSAVELPGLRSCLTVRRPPDGGDLVFVLCSGDGFETGTSNMASEAMRRMHAGIATVRVAPDGSGRLEQAWRAADDPGRPAPSSALVPLDQERVVFAAWGDRREGRPDRVYLMDLATSDASLLLETDAFAVGPGHYQPSDRTLLLPDASAGLRRWVLSPDGAEALDSTPLSPCRGLPARELSALAGGASP